MHASAGTGMGGNASLPGLSSPIGDPPGLVDPSAPLIDNPFASLMGLTGPDGGQFPPPGLQHFPMEEPKPKSFLQRVLPLLHLTTIWCLLAYFILWAEPKTYVEAATGGSQSKWDTAGLWRRWAELGQKGTVLKTFRVQIVVRFFFPYILWTIGCLTPFRQPFFWAFTTLEIILHSLRIFTGHVSVV